MNRNGPENEKPADFVSLKPGTLLAPVPAVLVSCGRSGETPNLITVAWAGTVNSEPPMCSVSIRPERFSHAHALDAADEQVMAAQRLPGNDAACQIHGAFGQRGRGKPFHRQRVQPAVRQFVRIASGLHAAIICRLHLPAPDQIDDKLARIADDAV